MFIKSVIKVYKGREEESDLFGTLIFIFVIVVIIFYFYFKVSQTQILLDWQNQRCNPKYIFFSYYLNPVEGQNPYTSIANNFMQCIKPYTSILDTKEYKDFSNTTKTITKTADSVSNYVNDMDIDAQKKIMGWRSTYNSVDKKANSIDDSSDEKYKEQKDVLIQIRIYAQRIHDILYSITSYVKNKLLFRVSENKKRFKLNGNNKLPNNDINSFKDYLYGNYWAISNNEYRRAFDLLQQKKSRANFSHELTDFSISMNQADVAIKKYAELIQMMDDFDRQNGPRESPKDSLLYDTIKSCNNLIEYDYNCQDILPNWSIAYKRLESPQNTHT